MKTASVGEIQKNFAQVLQRINWPDFMKDAVIVKGKPISDIIIENRDERF